MHAEPLTVKKLFQKDVRYMIPPFQRPYVWTQEDQWEPLWTDVRSAAERYLDELAGADGDRAAAETRTGTHFLGALVLQQELTASADIETRTVIDGQQRITTLQILVDAAQEALEEIGNRPEAKRLARLVLNAFAAGDEMFKVWPTTTDQAAFRAAMTNGAPRDGHGDSLIVQAHEFFRLQVLDWIDEPYEGTDTDTRIHALETALLGLLELVVIDLGSGDNAYLIFETLNARGTPLLASDLIKNFLLRTASEQDLDSAELHDESWKALEDPWWREEVRQGRLTRPRLDVFLNYWLIMRLADEVPSHTLFLKFQGYATNGAAGNAAAIARDIRHVADRYNSLEHVDEWSPEGVFMHRWRTMDAGVTTPVVLWLYSQPQARLSRDERLVCLRAIESYLVRRMACRMTSKDYNRLFLDLLVRLKDAETGEVAKALVDSLSASDSESRLWPSDIRLTHAFAELPLYRLLTRGRLRILLEGIEEAMRGPKSEEAHVPRGKLTIEHVMPQRWEANWPLPGDVEDQEEALHQRERTIHTMGNLTLVNHKLNPSMSNAAWSTKAAALADHSVLRLNQSLLVAYRDQTFEEAQIAARARDLAQVAQRIWPTADRILE